MARSNSQLSNQKGNALQVDNAGEHRKVVVLDTETGGLDATSNSLLTLGAVLWEDGEIKDELDLAVLEPELQVDPQSLAVNRIDLGELERRGLPPATAAGEFLDFLRRHFLPGEQITLAGHNVSFDVAFLKRLFRLAGKEWPDQISHRTIDTSSILGILKLAGLLGPEPPSLDAGLQRFGLQIAEDRRHTAIGDARGTAELLTALTRALANRWRDVPDVEDDGGSDS